MTTAASRVVTRLASMQPADRSAVRSVLESTSRFRASELTMALGVFDAAFGLNGMDRDPDYKFVGAYDAKHELLGFAAYGPTPDTDNTWDLYWIAVSEKAQGGGVGAQLLEEVERRIARVGGRLLMVETSSREDYDRTRGFYETRGYHLEARIKDFYEPSDDRLMLTKEL
jgi:ribosomal protein S18 acetylase RimI-like enzyme